MTNFGSNKSTTLKGNQLLVERSFKLNCVIDREMDVSTSALVDGVADCLNGMCGFQIDAVKRCGLLLKYSVVNVGVVNCRQGGGTKYFNHGAEF